MQTVNVGSVWMECIVLLCRCHVEW